MHKGKIIYIILTFIFVQTILVAQQKDKHHVAVLNFQNNTGSIGFDYLSASFSEAISATIAQLENISVVERNQINKITRELAFSQTGVTTAISNRAGELLNADVLILGTYSGNPHKISLSLKAVDVETGEVISGRTVSAPLSEIFDYVGQAGVSLGNLLAGAKIGYLNISTSPAACDIYLDGMKIGKSPLVMYQVTATEHTVQAVCKGYRIEKDHLSPAQGETISWNPVLDAKSAGRNLSVGLGIYSGRNRSSTLQDSPLFSLSLAKSYQRLTIAAEFAYTEMKHNQQLEHVFGTQNYKRLYKVYSFSALINFALYEYKYFKPYLGAQIGFNYFKDYNKESADWQNTDNENMFLAGLNLGCELSPYSKLSLFLESRYHFYTAEMDRRIYETQGLYGGKTSSSGSINVNRFVLGGGIRYYFD